MKYTDRPSKLSKNTSKKLLSLFNPETKSYQIVKLLTERSKVPTVEFKELTKAINPTQLLRTGINPRLFEHGYRIGCEKKAGSKDYIYSIYRLEVCQDAS